jgi:hypothetical protein
MKTYIIFNTKFVKMLLLDDREFFFDCPDTGIKNRWLGYKILDQQLKIRYAEQAAMFLANSMPTYIRDGYFLLGYFLDDMSIISFEEDVMEFPDDESAKLYFLLY